MAGALLALAAGCATAWQEPEPGAEPVAGARAAAGEAGDGARLPGEDRPRARTLTVAEAVREALAQNRTVLQARTTSLVFAENTREARSAFLPRLDWTGRYQRRDEPPRAVASELGTSFTTGPRDVMNMDLGLGFPIFAFGRHLNTYRAARLSQRGVEARERATEADIAAAVTAAAYDVLEAARAVEVSQSDEDALLQQVRDAQSLLDAGRVTRAALLDAQVQHDRARRDREKRESTVPILRRVLNGLLGRPVDMDTRIVDEPDPRAPTWVLAALEQDAVARRPELAASRLDLEASRTAWRAAVAQDLPELRGSLSFTATDSDFTTPKDAVIFGLSLDVPLYTGGGRRARIRRARHEIELARLRELDLETEIRTEVARTYRAVREAYLDIEVARRSIERSEESLRIQREKFTNGRATSREVLDSNAQLTAARFDYVTALYDYAIALSDLHRARGADPAATPSAGPRAVAGSGPEEADER